MISSLSRYRKRLTTKFREIHFIKAETGQQSPRQCPDGNRHSDDGKPKDIGQRYRGKHGSGRTCYKVRGWSKATRNAMILKVLNEMTKGKEVTVENLDSLKDIFNEQLDPAIADNAVVITNQSGFNYLDKLKDKDGNYILQKDPTQQTKGKMLFGEYPIIKLSKKTLASEKIMNTDVTQSTGTSILFSAVT